ncbi:pimeloyl-ACP methyl ester carboxylesterase [Duganella sp. 1224]|uniref:epoxide hydrolase family protein n=1 Tax=Duganella sp. 1224 TaxID=2587052 RepID=UPI0015C8DF47|nr:epoxide hydrolase [Duganella sp. 1224]NYE62773.1 pimeloyl-ACP methyl ester carboxylesterase [Duganella sp. 1224]
MQATPTQPARRALLTGKPAAARRAAPPGLALPPATSAVTPFRVDVPQALLDDLKLRLSMTRWPNQQTGPDWAQGVPLKRMQDVARYWQQRYDWRRTEARLNAFPQFRTEIDGVGIHFLHVRSKHENALPLILTHGWPGSIFEFLKVIGPLTDPTAHGGKAEDAFHVVVPSLPGFGFSDKPRDKGWNVVRIAQAWGTLMARLGYSKWVAQGGDWGAGVTTALGHVKPAGLAGIHLNWQFVFPEKMPATLSADEQRAVDGVGRFLSGEYGYFNEQATRPQTVGEVLSSTPVGQAAWIYEKFQAWSDNGGDVENVLTRDEMLDDISLYWLTNTSASSARIYWENSPSSFSGGRLDLPVAVSVFPKEIYRAPRSWAEQSYPHMIYWNEVERGGHFAAFEQPALFVRELRAGFAKLR